MSALACATSATGDVNPLPVGGLSILDLRALLGLLCSSVYAESAPVNLTLRNVISKWFSAAYQQREAEARLARGDWAHTLPLFSMTEPLMPGQVCAMHVNDAITTVCQIPSLA